MNSKFSCREVGLGVKVIQPFSVEDNRGYFLKSFEKDMYAGWGMKSCVNEMIESYSKKGVIRGLHFQADGPQAKMVRALKGEIRDVAVDLRKDSETFGQHVVVPLSGETCETVYVPDGFAHGYEVLSDEALVIYLCDGKYSKESDGGIRWNDPEIGVDWVTKDPIVSEKDAALQSFEEFKKNIGGL